MRLGRVGTGSSGDGVGMGVNQRVVGRQGGRVGHRRIELELSVGWSDFTVPFSRPCSGRTSLNTKKPTAPRTKQPAQILMRKAVLSI